MGFKFEKPAAKKNKTEAVTLTEHQKAYREREKREEERYNLAVDSRFWICFCFNTDAERAEFAELAKADDEGFCFGDHLRDVFTEKVGVSAKRQFKPKPPLGEVMPDPYAGLEPTDDLEADCFAEADALLAAFEAVNHDPGRCENIWDSPYHVVAVFRDAEDTDRFIRDFTLAKFGDLYMDGPAVLKHLKGGTPS